MPTRLAVGCMTGTSIDALDASLVEIDGEGISMRASHIRSVTTDLGPVAPRLRRLAEQVPMSAGDIAALSLDFAKAHVDAIRSLLAAEKTRRPDLICIHGQTVFHKPPLSWQLINPAPIAVALGCPVVYDLRSADLARAGRGAPITPIADAVLFSHPTERRAVVNLGGFANYTLLPEVASRVPCSDCVRGGDICACNQLLDGIARVHLNAPFDAGGMAALAGKTDEAVVEAMYLTLRAQHRESRSLGTGDELGGFLRVAAGASKQALTGGDLARSACDAIGRVVREVVQDVDRVLLAGGGCRNGALVPFIASYSGTMCSLTDDFDIPAQYRESICFAVLGALCQDRVPITIPAITGGRSGLSGAWMFP